MGNDIVRKIYLGLILVTIAVTIVVTILDKTGCMDSLIKSKRQMVCQYQHPKQRLIQRP